MDEHSEYVALLESIRGLNRGEASSKIADGFSLLLSQADDETEASAIAECARQLVELLSPSPNDKKEELSVLFQMEAKKRLAGLSISLMGIFSDESDSNIELSAGHLHAIKGSSAMLGFSEISRLASSMEEVIFEISSSSSANRQKALKVLLRSYSILESLVDDPNTSSVTYVDAIVGELHGFLAFQDEPETVQISEELVNEFLQEHVTDVQLSPLEKRILVVEDEATIAASVAFVLSELDLPIDIAPDGAAALDKLNDKPYSLVISDIGMPNLDGFALLQAMRADVQFADIPVVMLTGRDNQGFRRKAAELGCKDYIVKGSIGGGALLGRVSRLLEAAPSVPTRASDASVGSVLLFERSESVRNSRASLLAEGAYDLTLSSTVEELVENLKDGTFDLIVLASDVSEAVFHVKHDDGLLFILSDEPVERADQTFPIDIDDERLLTAIDEAFN